VVFVGGGSWGTSPSLDLGEWKGGGEGKGKGKGGYGQLETQDEKCQHNGTVQQ